MIKLKIELKREITIVIKPIKLKTKLENKKVVQDLIWNTVIVENRDFEKIFCFI